MKRDFVDTGKVDNGFLAMKEVGGWPAMIIWGIMWALLLVTGLKAFRNRPTVNGAYLIAAIIGCIITGSIMRAFQVFPVWAIISLVLGLYLSWLYSEWSQGLYAECSVNT